MAAPFAFERWASIASLIAVISFLPAIDGGASAYKLLTGVGEELDAGGAIIEVGSDRGEGSTSFLSSLANTTGKSFFSIDFSDEGFCNAREVCGGCAYQGMGEVWLADNFPVLLSEPLISLAYLDNYDWTWPWTTGMTYKIQQRADYSARGLSLGNEASQEAHLHQARLVAQMCTQRCFILFDDTWPSPRPGVYSGKGGTAAPFLLANGFEVVQQSSPDSLSYMGWVLLRRLPAHQRREEETVGWISSEPPEPRGDPTECKVSLRDDLQGGDTTTVLAHAWGASDGEHSLVVYRDGMEVYRYTDWFSARGASERGVCSGVSSGATGGCAVLFVLPGGRREGRISAELVDCTQAVVAHASLPEGETKGAPGAMMHDL